MRYPNRSIGNNNPNEKKGRAEIMRQSSILFNDPNANYPQEPAATMDDTSKQAAQDMKRRLQTIRADVLEAIKAKPITVHECAARLKLPVATVQPRFSELRKMGLIEDGEARRLNEASGKRAIVWQPVAEENAGLPKAYRDMLARNEQAKIGRGFLA